MPMAQSLPGNVRPVDQNGDYKIDAADRVILGNRNPRWTLGWSNTFSWKGLELNLDLFGRFKYKISTGGEGQLGMYQQREIDYWTPDNTGAEWQKPIYNQSGGDPYSGLLGFKDASFIKIRNLSLGYRLDKTLCDKIGIQEPRSTFRARTWACSTLRWISWTSTLEPLSSTAASPSVCNLISKR